MIKILKVGKIDLRKAICHRCETHFEFSKQEDAYHDYILDCYFIKCPICKETINSYDWEDVE